MSSRTAFYVAVSCPGEGAAATAETLKLADELGVALARAGAIVLCGGLGGAMDALARGVSRGGGTSIGLLPGTDRQGASPSLTLGLPTGLGQARNAVLATAGDVLIAVGRGYGTLSEVAFALRMKRPVVTLCSWHVDGAVDAPDVASAVQSAISLAVERR